MLTLKIFFMAIRSIGILYLFYLQYIHSINIPMSVIVIITLGSLGGPLFCKSRDKGYFFRHVFSNYAVALAGIAVILKEYM